MPPNSKSHVTTVEEVIGTAIVTARRADSAMARVRTIRVDTEKLDHAIGKAAKPLCDFLEALAGVVSPEQKPEEDQDHGEEEDGT